MIDHKPAKRFSIRVDDYVKYRPSYPTAVFDCLRDEFGLTDTAVIADIGSGTGLLSKLFLDNGNRVVGVEPNPEMRAAGECFLAGYANFTSVNGTAEATTLPDDSVDFVTAGQAAHWFDARPARREFERVLRGNGRIIFIWNNRDVDASPFMQEYEALLDEFSLKDSGYPPRKGGYERAPEVILGDNHIRRTFANRQSLDFAGLLGRSASSSMMPWPGHPQYEPMAAALQKLFERYAVDGRVQILYKTSLRISNVMRDAGKITQYG
ncbi:MAG TPA: SAM-dependent methyltransferase [Anaerolineae bacterium]|nr:SAM-dependent methyltransferase [Anaerolineae bacterium]